MSGGVFWTTAVQGGWSGEVVEEGCQARGLNGEDAEGHGGWPY